MANDPRDPNPSSSTDSDPKTDPVEEEGSVAPETDVQESDPNADSPVGLAGDMGISSERVGELRGADEIGTYGAMDTRPPAPENDLPPEQSADPATGAEPHPDQPALKDHGPRSGG